jgi:Possible hemagglutinin (DUF637)/Pre-toxin domain with VENN motif
VHILTVQARYKSSFNPAFHPTVAANCLSQFAATITLEGVKTTVQTAQTSESNYVVWQKLQGAGSTTQTFALPSFVGGVKFNAPGGLTVQIPQGSALQTQLQTLAAQPGMAYLNDIAARSDVNWQPVKLAFDQWSYQKEGLTPAGAALLAVAVAWATGLPPTTGVLDAMQYAAVLSIRTQAVITLVNNKGNVGKTLSDLASSNTVKAAVAAALTVGVLNQVAALPGMQTLSQGKEFTDKLTYNLINAAGRALTSTAINGGTLESALKDALVGGMVDTAQGAAASQIKLLEGTTFTDYAIHKLAHALAGCVAGAAAGGACQDGAIGAAVGEMVAGLFTKPGINATAAELAAFDNKVLAYSKLVAGGISAYAGGNAQTAITSAETAVRNNYLTETQKQQRDRAIAACKESLACAASVLLKYGKTDAQQEIGKLVGIMGGIGYQSVETLVALADLAQNLPETFRVLTAIVSDPEFRAKVGDQIANEYQQRIDLQTRAYNEGGYGGSITTGVEAGRLAVDVTLLASAAVGATKLAAKAASAGGVVVTDAATQLAVRGAAVFDKFGVGAISGFKSANEVNALMQSAEWAPAWKAGTAVAEATLKPGTRLSMVVDELTYLDYVNSKRTVMKFGGWATIDAVPNQAFARNQLAITPAMKLNVGYVVEVEITQSINANIGVVGAQGSAPGGANQVHLIIPGDRSSVLKVVSTRKLP